MKPYSKNKFAYNWHWFWDTGNGDIGNQGVHEMDICLWGLGRGGWPSSVTSAGGKYVWRDDQETPNTQQVVFEFDDGQVSFDVRNLPTTPEGLIPMRTRSFIGNIFFGDLGVMVVDPGGFQVYRSTLAPPALIRPPRGKAGAPRSTKKRWTKKRWKETKRPQSRT